MNTKKLVIIVAAAAVALALAVAGIFAAVKGFGGKAPADGADFSASSAASDVNSENGSGGTSSDSEASGGKNDSSKSEATGGDKEKAPDKTATAGKTVSVPIKFTKNPGVCIAWLVYEYDATVFTYDSCDNGDIFDICTDSAGEVGTIGLLLEMNGIEDTEETGTVATLNFTVNADAKKGDYELKLSDKTEICNSDEKLIAPDISASKVTVK